MASGASALEQKLALERKLQPVGNETLGSIITTETDLAILATLVERTGLLGLTQDTTTDPLTVFAPTNDAFLSFTRGNVLSVSYTHLTLPTILRV